MNNIININININDIISNFEVNTVKSWVYLSLECTTLAGHRGVRELLLITQGFALSNGWGWSKMALS